MKHGTIVQKKRRNYKRVEVKEMGWDWDPWENKSFWGPTHKFTYEPDGWVYYGPIFRYRYDPVPDIHRWRNTIRPYVRCMRTTQERRWSCAHKEHVRGRRNYINLPNSWDDYWHARRSKGWKRSKKKRQWMRKGDRLNEKF